MYEYDTVYDIDEIPQVGGGGHRKVTRYDLDTMTPAEIDAYVHYIFSDR